MKLFAIKIAAVVLASMTFGAGPAQARGAASTTVSGPTLGIIGNYSDADLRGLNKAGAADALVEMSWAQAEPVRGVYDERYFDNVAARIARLRALGYTISFNTGMHEAPDWLLKLPGARYVDQHGQAYTDSTEPNLVFGTEHRVLANRYLKKVFTRLGGNFSIVRVGGGHWGELTYPAKVDPATGKLRNLYYAFDANAKKRNPVPAWKPGQPSPNGEAAKFLKWYLDSLTAYQNWQLEALRLTGYTRPAAVLYPSYGMRAGDFERAVATNLAGTSSPEINGEVQRGYDAARQVAALTDRGAVVYGTWGENQNTVAYLAGLARAKGLRTMAETSHDCRPAQLPVVLAQAQWNNLAAFYVVRLPAADIVKNAAYLTSRS